MQIKVKDKVYPMVENPTLGEFRVLKRDFDVKQIDNLNPMDPDHIVGIMFVSMRRVNPRVTLDELESLPADELEILDDEGNPVEVDDEGNPVEVDDEGNPVEPDPTEGDAA